jgi:hypothetical protein
MRPSERQIMSIMRKLGLPAAAITTAAIGQGAGTAATAAVSNHSDTAKPAQAAAPRRARAIDILDHGQFGLAPDTAHRSYFSTLLNTGIYFFISGTGNHVRYTFTSAYTGSIASWPNVHLEIEKPNGKALANGPTTDLKRNSLIDLFASPSISDKGTWHAILWYKYKGKYEDVVSTYINVG